MFNFCISKKIILFVLLFPIHFSNTGLSTYVLWNVGQGQWFTYIQQKYCLHIDMGGDFYPIRVERLCKTKKNFIYISHWDRDHFNFVRRFERKVKTYDSDNKLVSLVYKPKEYSKSRNQMSHIYQVNKEVLLPGDSYTKQEKIWMHHLEPHIQFWVLGHHGSRTSNHEELVRKLSSTTKMAFASARKSKYGHPHPVVKSRLKKYKIPLLKTEDWGHIYFR